MEIQLYNTLFHKKEVFKPIVPGKIGMYCCGPTVYNYPHIGNLRMYVFEDLLKRMLVYNGYEVKQVDNITDVGHLISDEDEGEDKMEVGAKREGKTVWEIAQFYTDEFINDTKLLNILQPDIWCKATDHIKEQIELIQCLEKKGFTYIISDGVYFDTSKLSDYGKLANLDIEGLRGGARIEVHADKKNKTDFALWKFSPKETKRQMEWDSPWGKGFPGWHIECSAMSMKYLGRNFDIHCGGVDHIPVHHTNEIAQSESCTGEKFVNYWVHGEFLVEADSATSGGKMSKSKGEFLRLQTLIDKGYDPLVFRYMCLNTHYRKKLLYNSTLLESAKAGYENLRQNILRMKKEKQPAKKWRSDSESLIEQYKEYFLKRINDDLNLTEALAWTRGIIKDDFLNDEEKLEIIYEFDRVLGLNLKDVEDVKNDEFKEDLKVNSKSGIFTISLSIPPEKKNSFNNDLPLIIDRYEAKMQGDYNKADWLRSLTANNGWRIIDSKDNPSMIQVIFDLGIYAEGLAVKEIENRGCKILKRNWKFLKKEIDIIYLDDTTHDIVFAEVKYSSVAVDSEVYGWQMQALKKWIREIWEGNKYFIINKLSIGNLEINKLFTQLILVTLKLDQEKIILMDREEVNPIFKEMNIENDLEKIFKDWEEEAKQTANKLNKFLKSLRNTKMLFQKVQDGYLNKKREIDPNAELTIEERDIIWSKFNEIAKKIEKEIYEQNNKTNI